MAASLDNCKIGHAIVTAGATEVGHTKGGTEISYTPTIHEKTVDLYGDSPMEAVEIGYRLEIKIFFAESDLASLNMAMAGSTLTTGTTTDEVGIGRAAGSTIASQVLRVHPISAGAAVNEDWVFTKAVVIGSPTFAFKIDEDRIFEVTFLALIDESATEGEKLVKIGVAD